MNKVILGAGVLVWRLYEQDRGRYGTVILAHTSDDVESGGISFDAAPIGARGKLVAVVLETRQSPHAGDPARGLTPTTPTVGEEITLGVGTLIVEGKPFNRKEIGVTPDDGRSHDWLDPVALHRCNYQTVRLELHTDGRHDRVLPDGSVVTIAENADFYHGRGPDAVWLGSIAGNANPQIMQSVGGCGMSMLTATDPSTFANAVDFILEVWHHEYLGYSHEPANGWPWPWPDSRDTDWVYAYDNGTVWITSRGTWLPAERHHAPHLWEPEMGTTAGVSNLATFATFPAMR